MRERIDKRGEVIYYCGAMVCGFNDSQPEQFSREAQIMKKLLVAVLVLCLALSMVPAFALELISGADTYPVETE